MLYLPPINGAFETQLDVGDELIAGDVIGNIDGNEIKVPVDGIILSLTPSGENVPKNYPVAIVSYTGFALNVEAENYLKTLPESVALTCKISNLKWHWPNGVYCCCNPCNRKQ